MLSMTACSHVQRISGNCPGLSNPPASVVELARDANDAHVDAWFAELDKHYEKLKACRVAR